MTQPEQPISKTHISACAHHIREKICTSRSKYRAGRRETAVKVFTIAHESKYLLIHNVPDININNELMELCSSHGQVMSCHKIEYSKPQPFCNVHLVKYAKLGHAIRAKKKLDDVNFMGSILHVCYAPELETIQETIEKLDERRKFVSFRLANANKKVNEEHMQSNSDHEFGCESTCSHKVIENETDEDKSNEARITSEMRDDKQSSHKRTLNQLLEESESEIESKKIKTTPRIKWRNK